MTEYSEEELIEQAKSFIAGAFKIHAAPNLDLLQVLTRRFVRGKLSNKTVENLIIKAIPHACDKFSDQRLEDFVSGVLAADPNLNDAFVIARTMVFAKGHANPQQVANALRKGRQALALKGLMK